MSFDFDVEMPLINALRKEHESDTEWNLRRAFLISNWGNFQEDRLVCLSHCFINIECYGCRYPRQVMETVQACSYLVKEKVEELRKRKKQFSEVKFVKANDPSNTDDKKSSSVSSKSAQKVSAAVGASKGQSMMSFVKSSTKYCSTSISNKKDGLNNKKNEAPHLYSQLFASEAEKARCNELTGYFKQLTLNFRVVKDLPRNSIELVQMAVSKSQMVSNCDFASKLGEGFECVLTINFVSVATGVGSSKKTAKHDAYTKAVELLRKKHIWVVSDGPEKYKLEGSDEPYQGTVSQEEPVHIVEVDEIPSTSGETLSSESNIHNVNLRKRSYQQANKNPICEFIIIKSKFPVSGNDNPSQILRQSADFNKMLLEFQYDEHTIANNIIITCTLLLEGQCIAEAKGMSKTNAKTSVSEIALEKLQQTNWTILVKKSEDCDGPGLSREELMGEIEKNAAVIPDSNIGNKLLRKMGWVSGGVGKKGTGISEPVTLGTVINREGLGLASDKGITQSFQQSVHDIIQNYAKSGNQEDLAFSPEFTKEERAIIHQKCKKFNLKSQSKGKDDERYLIVGRKRSAEQLFSHIAQSGGATSKYELLPPGGQS